MKALVLALVASLVGWVLSQQPQACPAPGFSAVGSLQVAALVAQPWHVQQQLPSTAVPAISMFCQRLVFEALLPSNVTAGFTAVTSAAVGGPNGALGLVDLFGVLQGAVSTANNQPTTATNSTASSPAPVVTSALGAPADPAVVAFQGPAADSQAAAGSAASGLPPERAMLGSAVWDAAAAGEVVLLPIQGGRLGAAPAQRLLSPLDPTSLAPVWVVAVSEATANATAPTTPDSPPTVSYNWVILAAGPPTVPSPCGGCKYPPGQLAGVPPAQPAPAPPVPAPTTPAPVPEPAPAPGTPTLSPPPATPVFLPVAVIPGNATGTAPAPSPSPAAPIPLVEVAVGTPNATDSITNVTLPGVSVVATTANRNVSRLTQVVVGVTESVSNAISNVGDRVREVVDRVKGAFNRLFGREPPPPPPCPPPADAAAVASPAPPQWGRRLMQSAQRLLQQAAPTAEATASANTTVTPSPSTNTTTTPSPQVDTTTTPSPAADTTTTATPSPAAGTTASPSPAADSAANTTAAPNPACAVNLGCGCNTTCAAAATAWQAAQVQQGGLWLLTRLPDDAASVEEMRRVATQDLGLDISGLVSVCQQGCWGPVSP